METRVTYSARASSMDSWDMENLKYLKKMSNNNSSDTKIGNGRKSSREIESGIYTYNNNNSEVEEEEIFLHQEGEKLPSAVSQTRLHATRKISPGPDIGSSMKNLNEENDVVHSLAPLDTCYLLDVVTIRNESVMAVRHPKQKFGSDGSSSAGSSIVEENFFDDVHEPMPDFGKVDHLSRAHSRSSSNSTLITQQSRTNAYKSPCPYCDNNGNGTNNDFFYLGQRGNFEDTSMIPTLGGEGPPEMPRTPSPYYVRLRRDLLTYTPALRQPRNFGMDKQGQLLIDYSPNWDGLEKYVRNLKRC